jgi:CRP-like cAMP-binding protein
VPLAENELLAGLSPRALTEVEQHLRLARYRRGDTLVSAGDGAGDLFLLTSGQVSVIVELPGGRSARLATLSAGMSLGEIAVLTGAARTADVRADTAVECYVLPKSAFDKLAETNVAARLQIIENMGRKLATMVGTLTAEVAALAR